MVQADTVIYDELAADLPAGVGEALRDELLYRVRQDMALAEEEQLLAAQTADFRPLDCGEQKMQVHPFFYHYWGRRLGYECWSDDEFVDEFIRDNESVRVRRSQERVSVPGWRRESVRYSRKFDL